jgi:hypothetical protein
MSIQKSIFKHSGKLVQLCDTSLHNFNTKSLKEITKFLKEKTNYSEAIFDLEPFCKIITLASIISFI